MHQKRYTDVRIIDEIYVSSSMDYFATVVFKDQGKHQSRDYWLGSQQFLGRGDHMEWNGAPAYFQNEVKAKLVELLKSGKVKFYEYDRDKNKRYEDLRYHWPGMVDHFIKRLSGIE
jgi:hypothetical protein